MKHKNRKPIFGVLFPRQTLIVPEPILPGESPLAFSGRNEHLIMTTDGNGVVTLENASDMALPYVLVIASKTATLLIKAWPFVQRMPVGEALALAIGRVLSSHKG